MDNFQCCEDMKVNCQKVTPGTDTGTGIGTDQNPKYTVLVSRPFHIMCTRCIIRILKIFLRQNVQLFYFMDKDKILMNINKTSRRNKPKCGYDLERPAIRID